MLRTIRPGALMSRLHTYCKGTVRLPGPSHADLCVPYRSCQQANHLFCIQELLRTEGVLSVPMTVYHHERVVDERTYDAASIGSGDAKDASADKDFGKRDGETTQEYLKREFSALKPFVIISLSYLLFTTTDGAIRMIVLLHAYNSGFTAWEVALMFTLYELAGGCPTAHFCSMSACDEACQHG